MISVGPGSTYYDYGSTFHSNLAWFGGAIFISEATSGLVGTHLRNNYASAGGAIRAEEQSNIERFQNVQVYSNFARRSAGIDLR